MESKKIVEVQVNPLYVRLPNGSYEVTFPAIVTPKDDSVIIRPKMVEFSLDELERQYKELMKEETDNG